MEGCWSDKRNVWCITSYFLPLPNFVVLCHCTCPFPWAFGCLYLILLKIKKITRKSLVLCYLILSFTLSSWIHVPASWMAHVTCFICCSIYLFGKWNLLASWQAKQGSGCLPCMMMWKSWIPEWKDPTDELAGYSANRGCRCSIIQDSG